MKKIVINKCYGGFGLSNKAVARYANLIGKTAYFFKTEYTNTKGATRKEIYVPIDMNENSSFVSIFTVPNPNEYLGECDYKNHSLVQIQNFNDKYAQISFNARDIERDDPNLIQVVEELGNEASGEFAQLEIVEIPDDVVWEIDEYDGMESVEESHRSWS